MPDDAMLRTRATYDAIALRFIENARDRSAVGGWLARFATGLPAGALVVDLGAGPGMDAVELRRRGLCAFSLDFSMGMLRAGVDGYPGPRLQGDARRLPFRSGALAGIWACASLLHLPRPHAAQALEDARRTLAPGGRLLVSVKQGQGSETETTRYGMPRFFQYWSGPELDAVLEATRFRVIDGATEASPRGNWLVRLTERLD
jgi:SAM-dependent methyltransferase